MRGKTHPLYPDLHRQRQGLGSEDVCEPTLGFAHQHCEQPLLLVLGGGRPGAGFEDLADKLHGHRTVQVAADAPPPFYCPVELHEDHP